LIDFTNLQELNTTFGIPDQVTFIEGAGGLPFISITNDKASALISIYAGQVLSFKPTGEKEDFFFISENAYFEEGKAIKGGIPICWPWFGAAPSSLSNSDSPSHGFARDHFWSVDSIESLDNGDTQVKLVFVDSEQTRHFWPHRFYLSLSIIIGDSLNLALSAKNTGQQAFSMTEALHTYFNVGDATKVEVLGLEKTEYLDKAENFVKVCQIGAIKISEETDHIHVDVKHDITISDPVFDRKIKIVSSGNKNVVVWNPWDEGSEKIVDLDSDDYKHFICVEIANTASSEVTLLPNEEYKLLTNYSV
jgi:glucose-6-phosphate 1-epimerase